MGTKGVARAGTPVLVPGVESGELAVNAVHGDSDEDGNPIWHLAAATVGVGLALSEAPVGRKRRGRLGRRRRLGAEALAPFDDYFQAQDEANDDAGNLDESWQKSVTIEPESAMSQPIIFEFSDAVQGPRRRVPARAPRETSADHLPQHGTRTGRIALQHPRAAAGILLAAVCLVWALWAFASDREAGRKVATPSLTPQYGSVPIDSIRVGRRVLTDGDLEAPSGTEVDPATWRHLKLEGLAVWDDGTPDVVRMETLQSPEWVAENRAHVGAIVPIPIDLVEIGLPAELKGRVLANEPCPAIQPAPGRVIISTINHLNADVMELSLRAHDGKSETVRPTGFHTIYSESRDKWLWTKELQVGEILRGVAGPVAVTQMRRVEGAHRVYNMTVETDHVYRVSDLGILVHNASSPNKMNQEIYRGQAPKGVDRVDNAGPYPGAQNHVHYSDGTSSNVDGTVHDAHCGYPNPSNAIRQWLIGHDWVPPPPPPGK